MKGCAVTQFREHYKSFSTLSRIELKDRNVLIKLAIFLKSIKTFLRDKKSLELLNYK